MAASVIKSVDQYAFNVSLVAYDHGIENVPHSQRLGFKDIKRNTKLSTLDDSQFRVPPSEATPQELSIDQSENVGVWVGMLPVTGRSKAANENASTKTAGEKSTKGKSVNTLALQGGYKVLSTDSKALRVVVPTNKDTASYYALADQDETGLCDGLGIVVNDVYFFPQYRNDDQTDKNKRKSEWSELVRKVSNPEKKITYSKHYDKTKFQVSPKRALTNELSSIINTFLAGGDSTILQSAIDLIDKADTDGAFMPPPSNRHIFKFSSSRVPMTGEECEAARLELLDLAPALKDLPISTQNLSYMSAGIVGSKIVLPYAHTRAFIVDFLRRLEALEFNPDDSAELNEAVVRCRDHVRYQIGGKSSYVEPASEPGDVVRGVLHAEIHKLQSFRTFTHDSIQALKDSQGDSAISTAPTLPQIWTKYGLSPDVDSAKLYAMGVHRHNVEALRCILRPLEQMIDDHCKIMQELSASLPPAESKSDKGDAQEI
ncbi:uncharacterized protein HMPREF1541_07965 [Cyphellophora europaea CBS 101466]|uniref:Uncharacterized protein n=1 Tax=Cyphellophora europaea (strain CBS 101466) TaxID=1220924 RepID=W2RKG8_CYPE1|nr:uncharacterized protein HMPREF1541_07965 [Cyphellophora europaea CBS 101466]ETN36977.1 hypothetical protein HMPREF1541_07965 [Cyphellophora europaea CBS 101466]